MVNCGGQKICLDEPCDGRCNLDFQWFCDGHCIDKGEPCNGKCHSFYCEEENKCIREDEPCGHKCLNPDLPIWGPWGWGSFLETIGNDEQQCLAEEQCTTVQQGIGRATYIPDFSKYMCNGICIPVVIPCNNTCLDRVEYSKGKFENLFGPVICHHSFVMFSDSREFWTKSLQPNVLTKVLELIGHTEPEYGLCLPGNLGCNNTCILEPDRPGGCSWFW